MGLDVRVFEPEDHAQARALWDSTEGVGLSDADSFDNVRRFLERNPGFSFVATDNDVIQKCHLLVFHHNLSGRAFWERIGAEERTTIGIFSLTT